MNKELPEGWVWTNLENIISHDGIFKDGDWVESKDQDPNGEVRLVQLADVGDGIYRNKSNRYLTLKKANELKCKFIEEGDILFARMPDPLGRACIFPGDKKKCVTVVDVSIIRNGSKGPNQLWFMYCINSPQFRNKVHSLQSGSTRKRISRKNLEKITFPLPPIAEQQRIVTKIEELFTNLDKGIEYLKTAQAELKITRQSVLKYAFEGKLTESWREENKDKIEPASVLLEKIKAERKKKNKEAIPKLISNNNPLPILPPTWEVVTTGCLFYYITSGSRNWKNFYSEEGAIFIRTQDIAKNKLSLENVAYVKLPSKIEGKRSRVDKNDILIGITGHVGKVALVDDYIGEAYVSQSVALVKLVLPEISKFVTLSLMADGFGKTQIDNMVYGMGRPVLNLQNLRNIFVPLPPLAEQHKIVEEIERYYSIVDNMENAISQALEQSKVIRQSILKKAFEGKLVPQDPNDEPASVLLEKIKTEKNNNITKGKYKQMRID